MQRIFLSLICILFSVYIFGQTKSGLLPNPVKTNETIGELKNTANTTIWSNNFNFQLGWVIYNTTGDNQNWEITNTTSVNYLGALNFPTVSNGYALFDSDGQGQSGGTQNGMIATALSIDMSAFQDIEVSFYQKFRRYIGNENTYFGVSIDGQNWTDIEVNALVGNNVTVENQITLDINSIASGQSTVWIRFRYSGSWDYAWAVDDVVIKGNAMTPTPEITSVSPNAATQGESLTIAISGQYTNFGQATETAWLDQASSTLIYGTNLSAQSDTLLNMDIAVPISSPPGMYNVNVMNSVDGWIQKEQIFQVYPANQPNWTVTQTANNHTILIPSNIPVTISGVQVDVGDFIGVFYDSLGTLACGGYLMVTTTNGVLTAWGEDVGNDGFVSGEDFQWKIFDASENVEYLATPSYDMTGLFPNEGQFVVNGISSIISLTAITSQTQNVSLQSGWNLFSTYIIPDNPLISDVMSGIVSDIALVKDENGNVYWPQWNINNIGNMVLGKAYLGKFTSSTILQVTGTPADPQNEPVSIPAGWSYLGYLRQSDASIVSMLQSIVSNINLVKDGNGNVYWPQWNINNIGNMQAGLGYQPNLMSAAVLLYPANSASFKHVELKKALKIKFQNIKNTGSNMTLGIPAAAWENDINYGDEIGVFNSYNQLVGSQVYLGGNMAVTVWGDDLSTDRIENFGENETYTLKVYKRSENRIDEVKINKYEIGENIYRDNAIYIIKSLEVSPQLINAVPNPANTFVNINYSLNQNEVLGLSVFDLTGKKVFSDFINGLEGFNSFEINVETWEKGVYVFELKGEIIYHSSSFVVKH